ncbi:MAG: hypothetical protein LUI14_13170 [Lachnospiraceae bacterium]|nr:hypothetical protein [Lachnospiraceae bacterium]
MAHRHLEGTENTENVEQVEKPDKPEKSEKEGILNKAKNFFAEYGKKKEAGESKENTENKDNPDESSTQKDNIEGKNKDNSEIDKNKEKDDSSRKSWELSPDQLKEVRNKDSEVAKEYREKHGLDEHGEKINGNSEVNDSEESGDSGSDGKNHGEDGERTRYSDLKDEKYTGEYEKNMDDYER